MITKTLRLAMMLLRVAASEKRMQYLVKTYGVSEDDIKKMELADPTGDKASYLEWIVKHVRDGDIKLDCG